MNYTIRYGEDIAGEYRTFLPKVMELDRAVYDGAMAGELKNMVARYEKNPRTFVFLMDGDTLAGYINFFPVEESMWERITDPEEGSTLVTEPGEDDPQVQLEKIPDDDIGPDDIPVYEAGGHYRLFIISVVVARSYREADHTAAVQLSDAWIGYMNRLQAEDIGIDAIAAIAVSAGGRSFLRTRLFRIVRECRNESPDSCDGNDLVYLCDGLYLKKLLNNDYYHKTFHDDVYLMLPYADHTENPLIAALYREDGEGDREKMSLPMAYLEDQLNECMEYECRNDVAKELRRRYLGRFRFLHTLDDYLDEDDPEQGPVIVGEEDVEISILAHPETNMYCVMLYFEDCRYSTSQLLDQCSHGYLKIRSTDWKMVRGRDPETGRQAWCVPGRDGETLIPLTNGAFHYMNLEDYLFDRYGLISCGNGKGLTCMTSKPRPHSTDLSAKDEVMYREERVAREMLNILSGETYLSVHQSFRIGCESLLKMAVKNLSVYDYYEAYMSEKVIAFVYTEGALEADGILSEEDLERRDEYLAAHPEQAARRDEITMAMKRIRLAATYVFIIELVMFQNTALSKMTSKVSSALAEEGDVSYEYVSLLYQEFAKTIKFWRSDNFKYYGTQKEAAQIHKAFDNDELRADYNEQQEILEKIVELKSALNERRNGSIINIAAMVLAVFEVQEYLVGLLGKLYGTIDIDPAQASNTFNVAVLGGFLCTVAVMYILKRKNAFYRARRLRGKKEIESMIRQRKEDPS